jgi:hypothetical protein
MTKKRDEVNLCYLAEALMRKRVLKPTQASQLLKIKNQECLALESIGLKEAEKNKKKLFMPQNAK